MGLRISRAARRRFGLSGSILGPEGRIVFTDPHAARRLALELEQQGGSGGPSGGVLHAVSLLEEALRAVLSDYLSQRAPTLREAVAFLQSRIGSAVLDRVLGLFALDFALRPEAEGDAREETGRFGPSRELQLRELLLFWLLDANPAARPVTRLLHESDLGADPDFRGLVGALEEFLAAQPAWGPEQRPLLEVLRAPLVASPDSLEGQLRFVAERWTGLPDEERRGILTGLDHLGEETAFRPPPGAPAPAEAPDLGRLDETGPQYSLDLDWMPRLVLLAKNAYVWLDQLSRRYGVSIRRLDEIPERELDRLAEQGITGLWLIGLWSRSPASARIKRLCGSPEAESSAYSLREYQIAEDLGGEAALATLRERALARGVRLAADMVPNHMGIDSTWVIEHPERFISVKTCPFPSYRFTGPDLSDDPRVGLFLEDHYRDHSDAAVVFKRLDRRTGEETYVYHGNDGTSMPWNDTAQLDYLEASTRQAVLETVLDVARRFSVIRFDAAMTLARRHIQRLWFPEPGTGGAIPSRAEHGLGRRQFERLMPREFWRDVVERVGEEAPDTLLLAEAFWLMEGFFVRTLGMHRVYNSAFMHMLRDGDNVRYRRVLRETLAFDPEILKRYVNFLSNPDERTAIDQFGTGDRYFGCCVLLATLPGLPMLAHGQLEGLTEKYGMEFRRPTRDEAPDLALAARHESEILPLLRHRELFAGVENFWLFDLETPEGEVAEDVFVFANGRGDERLLVLFNNRDGTARGRVRRSAPVRRDGERETPERCTLVEALGLTSDGGALYAFRDLISGLEYLRPASELVDRGLEVHLGAYEYHVLADFRPLPDDLEGSWRRLAESLEGRGVPSLDEALREEEIEPVRSRLAAAFEAARSAVAPRVDGARPATAREEPLTALGTALAGLAAEGLDAAAWSAAIRARLDGVAALPTLLASLPWPASERLERARRRLAERLEGDVELRGGLCAALLLDAVRRAAGELADAFTRPEAFGAIDRSLRIARLATLEGWLEPSAAPGREDAAELAEAWLRRPAWQALTGHNRHDHVDWVSREDLEDLLERRAAHALLAWAESPAAAADAEAVAGWLEVLERLRELVEESGYRADRLLARLGRDPGPVPSAGDGS